MPRRDRLDFPGSSHHVGNRGIARRPMFEDREDVRFFLSRVAREVRRGRLRVHAWCVLTTHFHLLAESPVGQMSEALRVIQSEFCRFYNRRHQRDGPLVRGRFFSRPVDSQEYLEVLVAYIDANPVQAGLCARSWDYPWCSAAQYVHRDGPAWLERSWVEGLVSRNSGASGFDPADYKQVLGGSPPDGFGRLVEQRARHGGGPDALDDLIGAAPPKVQEWLRRKARLADGVPIGQPVVDCSSVSRAVALCRASLGDWMVRPHGRGVDGWSLVEVGLLRDLGRATWDQIARNTRAASTTGRKRHGLHLELLGSSTEYEVRFSEALALGLRLCFGERGRA